MQRHFWIGPLQTYSFLQFLTIRLSGNLHLYYIFISLGLVWPYCTVLLYIVGPLSKLTETSFFCWRSHKYEGLTCTTIGRKVWHILSIYGVDLKKVVDIITQVFVTSSIMTKLLVYTVKSQKCVYLQVIKIRIKSSSFVHVVQPP